MNADAAGADPQQMEPMIAALLGLVDTLRLTDRANRAAAITAGRNMETRLETYHHANADACHATANALHAILRAHRPELNSVQGATS